MQRHGRANLQLGYDLCVSQRQQYSTKQMRLSYRKIGTLRHAQQPHGSRHMMIFKRGLVIVSDRQRVRGLDQEVIVQASVLVVVH